MSGDRGLLCCARMMSGHSSGRLEKTSDSDVAEDSFASAIKVRLCNKSRGPEEKESRTAENSEKKERVKIVTFHVYGANVTIVGAATHSQLLPSHDPHAPLSSALAAASSPSLCSRRRHPARRRARATIPHTRRKPVANESFAAAAHHSAGPLAASSFTRSPTLSLPRSLQSRRSHTHSRRFASTQLDADIYLFMTHTDTTTTQPREAHAHL